MTVESAPSNTVKFNAGGQIFEVLREPTLSLHPKCLLWQLAEDYHDATEPIFVEVDGDIFKHILNYLRYRKVRLPSHIPVETFMEVCETLLLDVDQENVIPVLENLRPTTLNINRTLKERIDSRTKDFDRAVFDIFANKVLVELLKFLPEAVWKAVQFEKQSIVIDVRPDTFPDVERLDYCSVIRKGGKNAEDGMKTALEVALVDFPYKALDFEVVTIPEVVDHSQGYRQITQVQYFKIQFTIQN